MNLPKVLHLVESWRPVLNGYTSRGWRAVVTQRELGIAQPSVWVASTQEVHGRDEVEQPDGIPVSLSRCSPREKVLRCLHAPYFDGGAAEISIREAAKGVDVLHVHRSGTLGKIAVKVGRALDIPVVGEVRSDLAGGIISESKLRGKGANFVKYLRAYLESYLEDCDGVVAASYSLGEMLESEFPKLNGRVTVVPNGVDGSSDDSTAGRDSSVRKNLNISPFDFVVGTTSKMYRYEGLTQLIDVCDEIPEMTLLLVGDGKEMANLRERARGRNVIFAGRVAPNEVQDYIKAMDVFAVPRIRAAITEFASPIKVVEAFTAGTPVIGSAVGDMPYLLGEGRGVLFPPGDSKALVAAIQHARTHPPEVLAAKGWVMENLNWPTMVERYGNVYREVLS